MSDDRRTFIEACLAGEASAAQLDDFVADWHASDDAGCLPAYLGMTEGEYARWVERPETLKSILFSRGHRRDGSVLPQS